MIFLNYLTDVIEHMLLRSIALIWVMYE